MTQVNLNNAKKVLRIKIGIILAILQWTLWFLVPKFASGGIAMSISVFGGLGLGLIIIVWWLFFSRLEMLLRWLGLLFIVSGIIIFYNLSDASIQTGLSGIMFFVYTIPVLTMAIVAWAFLSKKLTRNFQIITLLLTVVFASGIWTLLKSSGINGNASAIFNWRWAKSTEERLLEKDEMIASSDIGNIKSNILWSGFRGNNRDGIVLNTNIATNWNENPPQELWRTAVGPGCSSFSVKGNVFYTQEQRGEEEVVSCYDINTGKLIWKHTDNARFWDSHAGAGPRSTPTLVDSTVYSMGATGILNAIRSDNGERLWSTNAAKDVNDTLPGWGYASSPLIVDSIVLVAVSGTMSAYHKITGEHLWKGPWGGENYCSPHLLEMDGTKQVLLMGQYSTQSFDPYTGDILWEKELGGTIIQPVVMENGDLLLSEGYRKGFHRVNLSKQNNDWIINDKWKTSKFRPDFNDICVHNNYLYGIDGLGLICIDLKDGTRKWKYGRDGGQILLLASQKLILQLTEKGEVILIEANPEKYNELAKIKAIEGKTWNHPVLINNILLVRNTQEMAAYKLPLIK